MKGAGDDQRSAKFIRDAEQAAYAVTDPERRVQTLVTLAETVAAAGDHKRSATLLRNAGQAAHAIADPRQQADALAFAVQAAADIGDFEWAQSAVRSIASPDLQAEALVTLAEQAPPDRAGPLIAQAFAIGDWIDILVPLARIHPSAVRAVVNEYMTGLVGPSYSTKLRNASQ